MGAPKLPNNLSELDKMLLLEQRFFLGDHNLIYNDKMSMANGVEIRVPYLDKDLLQYANTIPNNLKINIFSMKNILKEISHELISKQITRRKKAGFGSPVRKLIKNELNDLINDTFLSSQFINRGLFSKKYVNKIIQDNFNGVADYSYLILSLLFIEIWFNKFNVRI